MGLIVSIGSVNTGSYPRLKSKIEPIRIFLVLLQEHVNLALKSRAIYLLLFLHVKDQLLHVNLVWKTLL